MKKNKPSVVGLPSVKRFQPEGFFSSSKIAQKYIFFLILRRFVNGHVF
jgi:hypothetical protein